MTKTQKAYFDNMRPGQTLSIDKVKNPDVMVRSAKEYIDEFGTLEFNADYSVVKKLRPMPEKDEIKYFFE